MNLSSRIAAPRTGTEWWRGAVIYQIYPRSFQDSNGDGIGDLGGILDRLEHVSKLGADAIWISPFFPSPMRDFGYDVSDYCEVDPMFGTLADFDRVIAQAGELGLKVLIDLVFNHTSDQHPWFRESRASRDNPRSNWYVWSDPRPDGTPPNNWLSIFGGTAWQWDSRRCQYYLHNFLTSQPDLNFHEPAVQDALLDVARFWLDRGVAGFRLDTINFYAHDAELRDNPALPPERRNDTIAPAVNPYNHQEHLYSKNRPETPLFLGRLRVLLDEYDAIALGEVGDAQHGIELLGEYTAGSDRVQMCYAFEFLAPEAPDAASVAAVINRMDQVAADGWACWAFSNHDVARHVSRWHLSPAALRAYAKLMICLRGTVCLYQGEELGLAEAELPFEALRDPYGIEFWPEYRGRDGCRTPMVWDEHAPAGGFSTGLPWLPVSPAHLPLATATQEADPGALLHHYRRAIALRHAHPALAIGSIARARAEGSVLTFDRRHAGEEIRCAFNLSDRPTSVDLPGGSWLAIDAEPAVGQVHAGGPMELGPWQACLLLRQEAPSSTA
ncbi:alpha-amylase family glycosyl hydrolase [Pararhodobacter sp. SW119]|uniref:alpha-amylase family glycosyl hydrolase n=1 Tax=Pararhodobacter sp. SW119 TaxID=2780075 RepID=UPI001ADEC9E8|nr:alpha-amylase family glycosyl hydrolase [Pararhodobacter sp. SW119]